jgi:hypothetical protein
MQTERQERRISAHCCWSLCRAESRPVLRAISRFLFAMRLQSVSISTEAITSCKMAVTGAARVCTRMRLSPVEVVWRRAACTQMTEAVKKASSWVNSTAKTLSEEQLGKAKRSVPLM